MEKSIRRMDINTGVEEARATESGVLVDVRTEEEYAEGHIPGSINFPSPYIQRLGDQFPDLDTPLFLYCKSGARSKRSCRLLASVGYTNITNLGGIADWTGPVEK
ncbi:MAG: rhodanese-like domain-containing protein [Oscillospiraceae bacterium]|nr:rhodanese-like domain-containing protein [Oscillospiraceae bacterium]